MIFLFWLIVWVIAVKIAPEFTWSVTLTVVSLLVLFIIFIFVMAALV